MLQWLNCRFSGIQFIIKTSKLAFTLGVSLLKFLSTDMFLKDDIFVPEQNRNLVLP